MAYRIVKKQDLRGKDCYQVQTNTIGGWFPWFWHKCYYDAWRVEQSYEASFRTREEAEKFIELRKYKLI